MPFAHVGAMRDGRVKLGRWIKGSLLAVRTRAQEEDEETHRKDATITERADDEGAVPSPPFGARTPGTDIAVDGFSHVAVVVTMLIVVVLDTV